jgi:gluconolactonase
MPLELTCSFSVIDPRFRKLALPYVHAEKLYTGCRWAEGPAWFAAGRYLVWSDIPNDRMLRWDETDGSISVFRQPSMNSNGNTVDLQGRLVTCEHRTRCVTRTDFDGKRTMLAERYDGNRFNSPNDVVVKSDGSIWFTDPSYGIDSDYEGDAAPSEIGACNVYRIDPADGSVRLVAEGLLGPNGLVFTPDEQRLLVSDSRAKHIKAFAVRADGTLGEGEVVVECPAGNDNIRLDDEGRIWVGAFEDGVNCFAPDGTLIGKIRVPEITANITFGGAKRNRMFIAANTTLYSVVLSVTGAGPTRS